MKILVMDSVTAKVSTLEFDSTDTIAHLEAKLGKITDDASNWLQFDGKWLGDKFSGNMTLADVGIQDGSLILNSTNIKYLSASKHGRTPRRPENDYLHYADAFKSGWREDHAKALLHLLLENCQDGTISDGTVTDEAWLTIQNSLKNSMKCSFQIDFLKERLCDYKQLYSVLSETTSPFFEWDRERKTITMSNMNNWREDHPELLLLCGPYIPYFDTLEEVCLLVNTTQSSKQRVSETSTNIDNARHPSDSNSSMMVSSTLIGKENRYLSGTMKILLVHQNAKVFPIECESTDTIVHLKAKLDKIPLYMMFDGKQLSDEFSENMTLADVGVQDGSFILLGLLINPRPTILHSSDPRSVIQGTCRLCFAGELERPRRRPEKDCLHYADAFKSGWREEHAKALLHLLLKLCQDGTISEGNVTDEAWLRIQNSLKNSMQCRFQIDFLKERLCDYKQLYSVLTETTSPFFKWDRERKTITITSNRGDNNWREEYPELLLLCGPYIPYFDTLEEVCLLLNTGQSSEQRISESSTNRKQVRQDIPRHSKLRSLF